MKPNRTSDETGEGEMAFELLQRLLLQLSSPVCPGRAYSLASTVLNLAPGVGEQRLRR